MKTFLIVNLKGYFDFNSLLVSPNLNADVLCHATEIFKDGGTLVVEDVDNNKYYVDRRIATETRDKVYDIYPGHHQAKIVGYLVEA